MEIKNPQQVRGGSQGFSLSTNQARSHSPSSVQHAVFMFGGGITIVVILITDLNIELFITVVCFSSLIFYTSQCVLKTAIRVL